MQTIESANYGGYAATDAENAFRILFENKYHTCIVYSETIDGVSTIVKETLAKLKAHNETIPNINDQMLSSVYRWEAKDDDGNLCYYAAEIDMGRFEEKAQCIHPFGGVHYEILSDPSARKSPSTKALTTLAMLGYLMTKEL